MRKENSLPFEDYKGNGRLYTFYFDCKFKSNQCNGVSTIDYRIICENLLSRPTTPYFIFRLLSNHCSVVYKIGVLRPVDHDGSCGPPMG